MDLANLSEIVNGTLPYQNIVGMNPIVLIGRANKGPMLVPIGIKDYKHAVDIFGSSSELTDAYKECSQAGGSNIYLIKIDGGHAEYIVKDKYLVDSIRITSLDASMEANDIKVFTTSGVADKVLIVSDSEDYKRTYALRDKTIQQLANEINNEALYGESKVYAEALQPNTNALDLEEISVEGVSLSGGRAGGLYYSELYNKTEIVLNNLRMTNVRCVGVLNSLFYLFPNGKNVYDMLSKFADEMHNNNSPCIVVLGIETNIEKEEITELSMNFIDQSSPSYNELTSSIENAKYEISEYVNIVIARFVVSNTSTYYISNGVASYCGLLSTLKPGESTTNKKIDFVVANLIPLNEEELRLLSDIGYTVFIQDRQSLIRVLRGVNLLHYTGGMTYREENGESLPIKKASLLGKLSNVTLLAEIINELSNRLDESFSIIKSRGDVNIITKEVLDNYLTSIRSYTISITTVRGKNVYTYAVDIDLSIYGEIDSINLTVNI